MVGPRQSQDSTGWNTVTAKGLHLGWLRRAAVTVALVVELVEQDSRFVSNGQGYREAWGKDWKARQCRGKIQATKRQGGWAHCYHSIDVCLKPQSSNNKAIQDRTRVSLGQDRTSGARAGSDMARPSRGKSTARIGQPW